MKRPKSERASAATGSGPHERNGTRESESARDLAAVERRIARGAIAHYQDAAYYDTIYRRRRADVRFYVELAAAARGPVLELGAGTGRVAIEIARRGQRVVGVDAAAPMLARAREKAELLPAAARALLTLRRADLRSLRLRETFPLIVAPFNVFMHLYTRRDLERVFATVRKHLAPRGRFVFDVLMPDLRAMVRNPGRLYRGPRVVEPESGRLYHYFESFEYDAVREVQLVSMVFQSETDAQDVKVLPLSQRQFFPEELATLLHYNGFVIEQRWGDFDRSPLTTESESQIIVARAR